MTGGPAYPDAMHPGKIGTYPAAAKAGGGYVWDDVLEYRVWCSPGAGAEGLEDGSDYYYAFASYADALRFSEETTGAKAPLALVLQREYLDESTAGDYVHVKRHRVTEWPVRFLDRPRRSENTIPDFLAPDAPENRLAILRGEATPPGR